MALQLSEAVAITSFIKLQNKSALFITVIEARNLISENWYQKHIGYFSFQIMETSRGGE